MAGRSKSGYEANRTTSSNAWKPPPSEGTTSPQRALRWQGQAAGQADTTSPRSDNKSNNEDSRSEKSTKSGSTNRTGGSKSSSKKNGKKKKEEKKEAEPDRPTELDWYGDPLNPGIDQSLGPGGSLYNFTAKGKPRHGMCNPPMNPQVRAALVRDLNDWQVAPHTKAKKDKPEDEDNAGEKEKKRKIVLPFAGARSLGDDDATMEASADAASASALAGGGMFGGSSGSSHMSSPGPSTMRRTGSTPHAHRAAAHNSKGRKKKDSHHSAWHLDLTQEGKVKPQLDTAPEGEVKHRQFNLKRQSRQHGFLIESMAVTELGHLACYHNSLARGHPWPGVPPVPSARKVKDLGRDLTSTSQSLGSISVSTMENVLSPPHHRARSSYHHIVPGQEAPSMERLLEMADHARHMGPHKLESLCRNTRISVHTAAKLPRDTLEGLSADFDDPLFSSRLGATPRTHTGKPLPVPHWGRNGSAPVLREAPELRQARTAAEAAR